MALITLGIIPLLVKDMANIAVFRSNSSAPAKVDLPASPFLDHVQQANLTTCGELFPALGQLVSDGAQYKIQSRWNQQAPNEHAVSSVVGLEYASKQYTGPAAGLIFAAPLNGSTCAGAAIRIVPYPASCEALQEQLPKGSALTGKLDSVSVFTFNNDTGQILFVPDDGRCVAVTFLRAANDEARR